MISDRLLKEWEAAKIDLGIEITAPFELELENGKILHAQVLVHKFGGSVGTLVVTNYQDVKPLREELGRLGYGFSVLSEPSREDGYDPEVFIEMLNDWQWTGDDDKKPEWVSKP